MVENKQEKKGTLQEYHEAEAEKMKGQPWYVRHKSTLLIVGLTVLGWAFCAVWSHYFPYGIW